MNFTTLSLSGDSSPSPGPSPRQEDALGNWLLHPVVSECAQIHVGDAVILKRGCNIVAVMADGIGETVFDGLFGHSFDMNLYRATCMRTLFGVSGDVKPFQPIRLILLKDPSLYGAFD
jgi:hypothetical protein